MGTALDIDQIKDADGKRTDVLRLDTANVIKVATGAASAAASVDTVYRCVCDADSHILVGTAPTATTDDHFMPSGHVEYIFVSAGSKIGVLGGNLYMTPVV